MHKLLAAILLITLTSFVSCNLLSTYDQVELMVGITIPLYSEDINIGLNLKLKDQAINKMQESQKAHLVETYAKIITWKQQVGR